MTRCLIVILTASALGCGVPASTRGFAISTRFALSRAECPSLPPKSVKAELIVACVDGAACGPSLACPLQVSEDANGFAVSGECPSVAAGQRKSLTLRWYVEAPTSKAHVVLAEITGQVDLTNPTSEIVEVSFTDNGVKPKTRASTQDTTDVRDRFNCDRGGVNACDGQTPSASTADVDTCSNLEELCKGTLFADAVDTCR